MRGASRPSRWRSVGWVLLYVLVAGAPLVLAAMEVKPHRGLALPVSVGLGFVALSVLGLQFLLVSRSPRITGAVGVNVLVRFHRQLTALAVGASVAHPVILFLSSDRFGYLLHVLHAPLRAQLAWGSLGALLVLVVTSVWRRVLHLSYPVWHVIHSALGVTVVGLALGHAFLVNDYLSWTPVRAIWAGYATAFLAVVIWVRVIKPIRLGQRPWQVVELWPEPGRALTVGLEPLYRHGGQRFRFVAGQFAWILTGRSPLTPTYNPFSMSSSALKDRVQFTIRDSGDFTSSVKGLHVGDTVYMDGPHGSFTLDRHPAVGYVFLAAGVGVTPFLSMLATLADQLDDRPCWLFLANRDHHAVIGVRQLALIRTRLNLSIVHVISRPTVGWNGERGHINVRVLARNLPVNYRDLHYFVCARDEVVRSMVRTLHRGLDIPTTQIHTEQFQLA